MKRLPTFLIAMFAMATTVAATPEWNHPKKDLHTAECDYTVGPEGVIYHNMGYPSNPPTFNGGWVTFSAENEGDPVSITFTDFNCLRGDKPVVFVYDGDEALKTSFTGYSKPAPEGYLVAMTPAEEGIEYTAVSGKLCVLYAAPAASSGTITGTYTATVTAGVPHDMTFVSATATNASTQAWRGAKNIPLLNFDIATDGTLNPLSIDNLSFDLTATAASGKVENIRLYSAAEPKEEALVATLDEGETSFAVSGAVLKRTNPYSIYADVKPDVTGALAAPEVSALSVAGESRQVDASAVATLEIANSILIAADKSHQIYTVGDDVAFFDAGGADGNIPMNSEGTATFIPATEGQSVKIDFSQFKLFDNSSAVSVGNNDVMKIYNGREALEENLIATLVENPKNIKSSAPDGSLTVWFRSKQGNENQRQKGWEATVSQFVPTQMTFTGLDVEAAGTETFAYAGQQRVPMLYFNIKAENQLNPIQLREVAVTVPAGAESAAIEKVAVFQLGENKNAPLSGLYAESPFSASGTALTGECRLAEGDNWFAVTADIDPEALNAMEASIKLGTVKVGDTSATPAEDIPAKVTISNHCTMTEGSHSHTLYSEWEFYSPAAPPTSYSENYPAVNADHIVTFMPSEPGAVVELEFSSFDVQYASTSYGTKALFEIYSGTDTRQSNLLWKLDDASKAETGPGKKLRSTAADGSLTVRFNPNTTSSYYTRKGWKAAVRQYIDHDAEVRKVDAVQASDAILAPGATGEPVIDFNVYTEGLKNPLHLTGVKLRLKGGSEIAKITLLSTGDTNDPTKAVVWGESGMPAEGNEVTILPSADNTSTVLADQSNWFRVAVDVNESVESDVEVDAALTALLFGDKTYAVENGDPEGVRLTKNIHIMQPGEAVVNVDKALILYDDGGPDGNYTKNFQGQVTLVPPVGKIIGINTVDCGIGSGRMYVYSGREAVENAKIGSVTGYSSTTGPDNLFSKADDGTITITFTGSTYSSTSGFAIAITPVEPVDHVVESVECAPASDEDVTRGAENVALLQATLNVSGNYGKISIPEIKADFTPSTNTADIISASLCYTGKSTSYSATTQIAKVTELADGVATFTLDEPIVVDEAGSYNLWIAADLSAKAVPDNVASVRLSSLTANGASVEVPEATGSRHIITGMGGTYRIGPSDQALYKTISAAVNALKCGVEDVVIFQLEDGEYKENIEIANVQGTSEAHPVIFTSLSGNRDAVLVTGSLDTSNPMVTVENTPYIHFRTLTFSTSSATYPSIILYRNSSRYGVIDNCAVIGAEASGSTGTSLVKTESGSEANQNCDYLTVKDSYFENGFISIYSYGSQKVAEPNEKGIVVKGNTIVNARSKGIYLANAEDFTVEGNTVACSTSTKNDYQGMDIYWPHGAFVIASNKVVNDLGQYSTGIYMRANGAAGTEDASHPAMVVNNAVSIVKGHGTSSRGIQAAAQIHNLVIAHNSSFVGGSETAKEGYPFAISGKTSDISGLEVRNNIFQGGSISPVMTVPDANVYESVSFSGNVYYGAAGTRNIDNETTPTTFESYQVLASDNTSLWQRVEFLSATDLHLLQAPEGIAMERLDAVAADADGKERPAQTTAGAYEFAAVSQDAPAIADGYPQTGLLTDATATVRTRWNIGGSLYSMVKEASEEAPTADEIKSSRPAAFEADAEVTTNFRFLDQLTAYKAYFLAVSALDMESDIIASEEFTTLETIEPLTVETDFDGTAINEGETLSIEALAAGGKTPYSYEWTDQMGNVVGSDAVLTREATVSGTYRICVSSADGQEARAKILVDVLNGKLHIADFDDLPLESESYWMFDTTLPEDATSDMFYSGSFRFPNYPWFLYASWTGYGYANETSTEFRDYHDQFRNVVGGGADGSSNYGVAYMMGGNDMSVAIGAASDEGLSVPGIYVTNTAYAMNSMLNGDGWCEKFSAENGDYFTLFIEGLDAAGTVKATVEIPLADFRTSTETRADATSVLSDWKWFDLSPLGKVSKLRFSYDSSQPDKVPAYACFDRIGAPDPAYSALDAASWNDVKVLTPNADLLSVIGIEGDYTLRIYSPDGMLHAAHELEGSASASTATLSPGTYIADIADRKGNHTAVRFIKR